MATPLESAIVRIRSADGAVVGAGFLVTERYILTCAHVVADALDLPHDLPDLPQGELKLDFPLIAPSQILTAQVVHWQPATDVAALKLLGDPPTGATPIRLITISDVWGHTFRAYGFPAGYDQGVWASGVLRGPQAEGWVQIEDEKQTGYFVAPGFSGTPVWDEQLNGAVGIAVAADVQPGIRAAFMIPTHSLIEAWPDLGPRSMGADSPEYLQEQLALLEAAQQTAPDPRRFQPRIDELRGAMANWDERVERQRQRIAKGLTEQRQQIAEKKQRCDEKQVQVVGRRPLDVTDYFKDREREQITIGHLLAEPSTRLVSVIGHGGMGKTALACKVLRDLEQYRWPHTDEEIPLDGIVYLSTRTAGISLERLFLDCAKLLGGEQEKQLSTIWTNPQLGTEDKITHLLGALQNGRYVILLDNVEDLLDDEGQLIDKDLRLFFELGLATDHGARLLVTSRIALAFQREVIRFDRQVKLLEGLPIPDGVALLRELDPNDEYGLRLAPEEQLAQAVSLVHGVPRALEVMAGILANDPFASLAEVLEGFYEHEDVVQALVEENYKRLDGDARHVIEALAVYRRPVPPLAVDFLLAPFAPGLDVPRIIRRLTRTNIVSVDRATKTVTLHPIDQDFAYSQLPKEESGESAYTRQALERRAADYYLQLRTPPETWKSIDDLEPQLTEFEHRIHARDYDGAFQVLEPIDFDYLYLWGHYGRLIEMREKLIRQLRNPTLVGANLNSLGCAYRALGQIERAIDHFKKALANARRVNDRRGEGAALGSLGFAYRGLGQVKQAIQFHEEALVIAREFGDLRYECNNLGSLGIVYRNGGQVERAIVLYEQALTIARGIGDRRNEGVWLGSLGIAYSELGQIEEAIKHHEDALLIARETGDRRGEQARLGSLGYSYLALGQGEKAIGYYEQALSITREVGDHRNKGVWLGSLGHAYYSLGQVERAINYYKQALAIARETGDRRWESHHLLRLSKALLAIKELSEARQHCAKALALDVPEYSYHAALVRGIILLGQHDQDIKEVFVDAIARCRAMLHKTPGLYAPRYALAAALVGQAICDSPWAEESKRTELLAPALEEYQRALKITSAPGVVQDALRDLEMIRAADIEGLEPVFELLEAALTKEDT